jgi:hypothetical protein
LTRLDLRPYLMPHCAWTANNVQSGFEPDLEVLLIG